MSAAIGRSTIVASARSAGWHVSQKQATHARRPSMSAAIGRSTIVASARSAGVLLRRSQNRQLMRGGRA